MRYMNAFLDFDSLEIDRIVKGAHYEPLKSSIYLYIYLAICPKGCLRNIIIS